MTAAVSSFDHFPEHLVNFQTRMHVTGNVSESVPDSALKRLVSLYVVQTLADDFVDEVYKNLVDAYVWSYRVRTLEQPTSEVRQLAGRKGLKIVDADPVVFEE